MAKKLTEDAVRDKARDILGFKDKDGVRSGVGQLTTFNQLGFAGVADKPDGWYLPDNHADTAIVLETKASYITLGDKQVDEVLKNVKIVQEQYGNVVGILYNGDDTRVFKGEIEFQGNGSNILHNLEYYISLFNKEHIDKEYIYELTAKINNCLHFEFGIKNLYHRMIFTACALVAKRYDALMVKGMDYSEFHNAILNCLNKELMRDKRQNQKLSLLSDVFSEIRMNLNVDSEDAKEQQRVKDLIGQFIDWVSDISDCLNSDAWRVVDGTFCYGKGKQKETPIQEVVLQIGNKDDNGVTDKDFDMEHWKTLKKSGHEKEASEYAISHLNKSENTERTKRILHKAVERIATLDPEHLIVIRATYHGDEPCGTGHGHLAYVLRATGYEKGMESRVASVKALEQMGFKKTKESEYGIVQLHEKFKEIIEEEMINDAIEYGYEAIQRTPDSGEHRKRSDVSEFREMAAERQDLKELQMEVNDAVADNQLREFALEQRENSVKRQKALNDEKSKEINDRDEQVRKKEMAFSEKNSELILRESNVLIKESEIDEREEKLKKKQEQDEKDFQMKEDKMEAQQRVISQREKSVSERENSVDVKENEVAQKSAEYGKKLVLLDSLIDDVQSYKSPVSVAKNVLEILKESMNEKGKRVTSDMIGVLTRNTDMLNRKYQAKINETRVKREQIQKGTYFDMSDEQDERGDRSL